MSLTSGEFLEIAVSRAPTPAEIDELLTTRVNEDLWLDYKRGRWLDDTDAKRARKLRRFVAGFANADGGAVLVGVAGGETVQQPTDQQWAVDGCPPAYSQPWNEWASNSLSGLAGYLSRQPVIHLVPHADGQVLVVAVRRSNGLVPCVEDGRPAHFMRIGHQTLPLDPSLYADLVLGRRQSPHFDIELNATIEPRQHAPEFGLRVNFIVQNESLVWVPDLQIGIIGNGTLAQQPEMTCTDGSNSGQPTLGVPTISQHLSGYVEVLPCRPLNAQPYFIRSRPRPALNTAPFSSIECDALFTLPTGAIVDGQQQLAQWRGAIYVAPINGLPQWFEVRIDYQSNPDPYLANGVMHVRNCDVVPVYGKRVAIEWNTRTRRVG